MYAVCMLVECCDGIKQKTNNKIAFCHTQLNLLSDYLRNLLNAGDVNGGCLYLAIMSAERH